MYSKCLQDLNLVQVRGPTSSYCIHCLHTPTSPGPQQLAAACSDGGLRLLSESGQVTACAEHAHAGSAIQVRWNYAGTALATGGEDGAVKTWSATAMVRATNAQGDAPVYGLAWGPDDASVRLASCCHNIEWAGSSICAVVLSPQYILQALRVS
jgi:WD40 repeat protein